MSKTDISSSLVVGITGGIGTGKSEVSKILLDMEFKVIDTDQLAKQLMVDSSSLKQKLIAEFGNNVYDESGELNRKFLADIVFNAKNSSQIDKLNAIVHPFVIDRMLELSTQYAQEGEKVVFIESALIYEAGLNDGFDYVVVVDAPKELCIERVKSRTGQSEAEIEKRMDKQISQGVKISNADFTIDNSSDLNQLKSSVGFVIEILKAMPPKSFEDQE